MRLPRPTRPTSNLARLAAAAALAAAWPGCAGDPADDDAGALLGPPGDDDSAADDDATGDDDASVGSLVASPSPLLLGEGDTRSLALTADGQPLDPSLAAWTSDDPAVATVSGGAVAGVSRGATAVRASYGGAEVEVPVEVALLEARGVWVTRWTVGGLSGESALRALIGEVADAGFNQVYLQVRGVFDALYASPLEPWSSVLDGLGVDPGWDPLAVAVDEAHARGLELHAWLNTFPFWSGTSPPASTSPEHPYDLHPEWLVVDDDGDPIALNSGYVYASPGNPDVRAWVAAVAEDIAVAYDVDGVHLDYIRYPGSQYSHDDASLEQWEAARAADPSLSWEDFERDNVTATVAAVSGAVWGARPEVKVTCAVWGVYVNSWGWSSVSQGYHDYYQDSGAFLAEGVADAILPMIYWPLTDPPGERLDWRTLAEDHDGRADAAGRHAYAGICASDPDVCPDNGIAEITAEVETSREVGTAGVVVFDYALLDAAGLLDDLGAGPFAEPALVPPMPWKGE